MPEQLDLLADRLGALGRLLRTNDNQARRPAMPVTAQTPTLPFVHWSTEPADRPGTPLVVALHGRGGDEDAIAGLTHWMPPGTSLAAVRAPIPEGPGYAWFMNRGIGRPLPESITSSAQVLLQWLDSVQQHHSSVTVLGFSDGMAMAGALILAQPERFSAAVLLSGTLPWDAGLPDEPGRLAGLPVFWGRDPEDLIVPSDLVTRTGTWLRESSGARLTERLYSGLGHRFSNPELNEVRAFLTTL